MNKIDILKYNLQLYNNVETLKCYEQKLKVYSDFQVFVKKLKVDQYFRYDNDKNILLDFNFWIYILRIDLFIKNLSNRKDLDTTNYIRFHKSHINIGAYKYLIKEYAI